MIMYWSGNQFSSITIFAIPFSFVFLRVSFKVTYYLYRGRFIERKRRKNATLARVSVGIGGDAGVVIGVGTVVVNAIVNDVDIGVFISVVVIRVFVGYDVWMLAALATLMCEILSLKTWECAVAKAPWAAGGGAAAAVAAACVLASLAQSRSQLR